MKNKTLYISIAVGLVAIGLALTALLSGGQVPAGGLVHFTQEIFVEGIKAGRAETAVINSSGEWIGTVNTSTAATFALDATLTDGRLIYATEATANCGTNAVTIDLAASAKGRVVVDQAAAADCTITFSNGVVGEFIIIEAIYGGDNIWTIANGGQYIGDTFTEANCQDFEATAANGDVLIITALVHDANTIIPLSCQYLDQ